MKISKWPFVLKKYETGIEDTYGEGEGRVYESDEDPLDLYSQVEGILFQFHIFYMLFCFFLLYLHIILMLPF